MNFFTWLEQKMKGKRRKKGDWVILLLIGVLLMVIAFPVKDGKKEKETKTKEDSPAEEQTAASDDSREYVRYLENRLETILGRMSGVGEVSVMITLKDEGTAVLDKDSAVSEKESQENTVIFSEDDITKPFVTQQQYPGVEGVVVVAQGAGAAGISTDIMECVMALFHVEAHKVKVLQMGN